MCKGLIVNSCFTSKVAAPVIAGWSSVSGQVFQLHILSNI